MLLKAFVTLLLLQCLRIAAWSGSPLSFKVQRLHYAVIEIGASCDPCQVANDGYVSYKTSGGIHRWYRGRSEMLEIEPTSFVTLGSMNNHGVIAGTIDYGSDENGNYVKGGFTWAPGENYKFAPHFGHVEDYGPPNTSWIEYEANWINDSETLFGNFVKYHAEGGSLINKKGTIGGGVIDTATLKYVDGHATWSGYNFLPRWGNNAGASLGDKYEMNSPSKLMLRSGDGTYISPAGLTLLTTPTDLNDRSEIVGYSIGLDYEGVPKSMAWYSAGGDLVPGSPAASPRFQPGDIGSGLALGMASASELIVGARRSATSDASARLWRRDAPGSRLITRDLNQFISEEARKRWSILEAQDVNDHGWIIAKANKYKVENGVRTSTQPTPFAVLLLPIEVCDGDGTILNELKVAKLSDPGVFSGPGSSLPINLDKEPDSFYVQIPGGSGLGPLKVSVGTVGNPDPAYNDDLTEVSLSSVGSAMRSKSMVFVADQGDEEYKVDGVADNAPEDRTHLVQLGGKLRVGSVKFADLDFEAGLETSVPIKKNLDIQVVMVRRSHGVPLPASASPAEMTQKLKRIGERYAQIGLKVNLTFVEVDPPPGVNLEDGVLSLGFEEHQLLLTATPSYDDLQIFVVGAIRDEVGVGSTLGVSFYPIRDGGHPWVNTAIVSLDSLSVLEHPTDPHEVGHILTNGHHEGMFGPLTATQKRNLMSSGELGNQGYDIQGRKRLSQEQAAKILSNPLLK